MLYVKPCNGCCCMRQGGPTLLLLLFSSSSLHSGMGVPPYGWSSALQNLELGLELPLSKPSADSPEAPRSSRRPLGFRWDPYGQVAGVSATPTCPSSCLAPALVHCAASRGSLTGGFIDQTAFIFGVCLSAYSLSVICACRMKCSDNGLGIIMLLGSVESSQHIQKAD